MLKKKNIYVISVSVIIIALVILSSFLGLIAYMQLRQFNIAYRYYEKLEEMDTASYAKNMEIDSVKIRLGFNEVGMVEGQIKNKGRKTVLSIALKVNFLDNLNTSLYSCIIYPLEPFQSPPIFKKMRFYYFAFAGGRPITANRSISFESTLWGCPKKFVTMLKKGSFSNNPGEWNGNISAEVLSLKLKPT